MREREEIEASEAGDIENRRDAAIAEDGGAHEAFDFAEVAFKALDDHLLLAQQLVDGEANFSASRLDDNDEMVRCRLGSGLRLARKPG